MGRIFASSDLHFGHDREFIWGPRGFKSSTEHDETVITNWNSVVGPEDTVYVLGDFGIMDILPLLNGKKILIKGNYERQKPELLEGHEDQFEEIHEFIHEIKVVHEGKEYSLTMTHEPSRVRDKILDDKTLVCYGHIHKLCMIKKYGLCVSADAHNFTPLSLEDVIYYHNAILNYYDDDVFY